MSAQGYSQLRNDVLRDNPLKPGPRLLYTVLASYAWKSNKVRVSTTRLGKDLNLAQRTIRRYLRHLEAEGYIRTHHLTGYVSEYELLVPYRPDDVRRIDPDNLSGVGADQRSGPSGSVDPKPRTIPEVPHQTRVKGHLTGVLNGSVHPLLRR